MAHTPCTGSESARDFQTTIETGIAPATAWRRGMWRLSLSLGVALLLLLVLIQSSQASQPPAPPAQFPLNPTPTPVTNFYLLTRPPDAAKALSATLAAAQVSPPQVYLVQPGDTLASIGLVFDIPWQKIVEVNELENENFLSIGQVLVIPDADGNVRPLPANMPGVVATSSITRSNTLTRTDIVSRLTSTAQGALVNSPFYKTTWVTYYGRPNTPIMGIIGAHDVVTLTAILKHKARQVDVANGPDLRTRAAYHLVHGMATISPGEDGSYMTYLDDDTVMSYIEQGLQHNVAVILDIQMGDLSVTEALSPALQYLRYPNVHLALDPEFAMSHRGQTRPGNPIGFVTGAQLNEAQAYIADYMAEQRIRGKRILLVHQFFDDMIINKQQIEWDNPVVELAIVADGFGDPWGKITKYNSFFSNQPAIAYTGLKLFYDWDEPLLSDRQALGVEKYTQELFVDITPNVLIWQ